MAFDIGQRVENRFLGKGTVIGEIFKVETDENGKGGIAMQRVRFDNPAIGERDREIRTMSALDEAGEDGAKA